MLNQPKSLARAGQSLLAVSVLLIAWMQRLEPGLKPNYAPISFYARSQHGAMLLVALLMMAAATLLFSRAYALLFPNAKGARPLLWLSVAIVFAGVLRAQQHFPWEGRFTLEGMLHAVASVGGFLLFAYAAFVIAFEQRCRTLLVLAGTFVLASVLTCGEAAITLLTGHKPQFMGLEERVILLVACVWFYALFPLTGKMKDA